MDVFWFGLEKWRSKEGWATGFGFAMWGKEVEGWAARLGKPKKRWAAGEGKRSGPLESWAKWVLLFVCVV